MAVVSFPTRNVLAYPAGRLAGFDPNHPAARNCGFSGLVGNGGSFGNILSRSALTEGGTKTLSIYSSLGSITNYNGNTDNTAVPFVSPANVSVTLASIFKLTANAGTAAYALNTAAASSTGIGWNLGGLGTLSFTVGAGSSSDTGVTAVLEKPYFFAASFYGPAATNAIVTWVALRLDTGVLVSGTVATADGAILAGDNTLWVGNRGANTRQLSGGIAAAMASTAFMGETQLRAWAQDPWAFWYPPQARSRVAAAAAATFLAGWASQTNLPVLGTGTY